MRVCPVCLDAKGKRVFNITEGHAPSPIQTSSPVSPAPQLGPVTGSSKGGAVLCCWTKVRRTQERGWLGWEPAPVGTLETDSLWATGMVLWLCLLTHLPKATGSPCAPFNSGDFRGPFLPMPGEVGGSPFFLIVRGGRGTGPGLEPIGSSSLSCCPRGLQHNRIWEIGADTFSQLSSLRAL